MSQSFLMALLGAAAKTDASSAYRGDRNCRCLHRPRPRPFSVRFQCGVAAGQDAESCNTSSWW